MKSLKRKFASTLALWIFLSATQLASAFYDPSLGRWINRDPLGERGGMNLYAFVRNAPVAYIDALGEGRICVVKIMLVTAYNDKGPGSNWPRFKNGQSVGPGTVAAANYSESTGAPTTPATPFYEYGSTVTVYDSDGSTAYTGEVHDTGAGWDKKHHNVPPGDWIDIWKPGRDANKFGKQRLKVKICWDDPCAKSDETIDLTGAQR